MGPGLRRSRFLAAATGMASALTLLGFGGPSYASDSPCAAGTGPGTGVRDVTSVRHRTATPADEVVITEISEAGMRVCVLETSDAAAAVALARDLGARPGITASVNRTLPPLPVTTTSGPAGRVSTFGETDGNYESELWGLDAIQARAAWATTKGAGALVAVLDTGVDPAQPDLAGRLMTQLDFVGDGLTGDNEGHGTHVAGIIAAAENGHDIVGVAPEATILPVRIANSYGATIGALVAGIQAATAAGAGVINISMSGTADDPTLRGAISWAAHRGVTLVAAAGNEYNFGNPTEYPSAYPDVIAVASAGKQQDGQLYGDPDSNAGPQVDISAPGDEIFSLAASGTAPQPVVEMSGTSMASPQVAGVAALVRVANPTLLKDQIDQAILGSAQVVTNNGGWTPFVGFGLLRADQAVATALGTAGPLTPGVKVYSANGRLRVDIDPDLPGRWQFQVERRQADGTWVPTGPVRRASGAYEQARLKLRAGTYRVNVLPRLYYSGRASGSATISR